MYTYEDKEEDLKMRYLVTCNENAQSLVIEEVKRHKGMGTLEWLNETEAILTSKMDPETLRNFIESAPIIFILHVFEIQHEVAWNDIYSVLTPQQGQTFSLQIRSDKSLRDQAMTVRNEIVDSLIADGFALDVKNPQQIVSVYFLADTAYVGIGTAYLNLSKWSSGHVHFSKEQASVSRAEYKLREAFDAFPLSHHSGLALDLGAAPGGWTKVLHDYGYGVIAIDPAKLDPRVLKLDGITHYKESVQSFMQEPSIPFAQVIVNDMKMTSKASIRLFNELETSMSPTGFGIITIKLPKDYTYFHVDKSMSDLRGVYHIIGARQLFHNRHEFTVCVQRKKK